MSPSSCLGQEVADYVGGRLHPLRVQAFDRHLTVCEVCRSQVAAERQLRARLAGVPAVPMDLHAALLALGSGPVSAPRMLPEPLALLRADAPPCHRSAARSTAIAVLVAGASAAAVWSLAVLGGAVASAGEPSQAPAFLLGRTSPGAAGGVSLSSWRRDTLTATMCQAGTP